jgi:hypothetical protein
LYFSNIAFTDSLAWAAEAVAKSAASTPSTCEFQKILGILRSKGKTIGKQADDTHSDVVQSGFGMIFIDADPNISL